MKKLALILILSCMVPLSAFCRPVQNTETDYLNSIKLTFLSWISGSTKISYERALPSVHQSSELCASLISAGHDKYRNHPMGFTLRYGHKFFIHDTDDKSLMGFYLRPELIYSRYHYDSKTRNCRTIADMGALLGTVGYQYVYRRFLADFWVGGGYAVGTPAETNYHHGFELWHWFGKEYKHLAMSFSIRLGLCF